MKFSIIFGPEKFWKDAKFVSFWYMNKILNIFIEMRSRIHDVNFFIWNFFWRSVYFDVYVTFTDSESIILLETCTTDEKYDTWDEKLQCISVSINNCCKFIQKDRKKLIFVKPAAGPFFLEVFLGWEILVSTPPYFFKKVVRRGGSWL